MLHLSPRLHTIADQVPKGARLADIGTDHAYLPVYLLQKGQIAHAIASDLREGPLSRGRAVAKQWAIPAEQISFRCCNGLRGIKPDEAETFVIAGMGGDTIAQCLQGVIWSCKPEKLFLLQPMSSIPELRRFLSDHGFCIVEECLCREQDKLYVIMKVSAGEMAPLSLGECWAGQQWKGMQGEHRLDYLDDLIARRERAIIGMRKARTMEKEEELSVLEQTRSELQRMREEWISWQV